MERRYRADFQKVIPYGPRGDLKCDGYHGSLKRVYQVYAPDKMNERDAIKKIETDFNGAVQHWKEKLQAWVFVHNQWRGIPAGALQTLLGIDGKNGIGVMRWCEPELSDEFFGLNTDDQEFILGPAPSELTVRRVQLPDLVPVIGAIAQQDSPPPEEIREVPAGKLEANALSENVRLLLIIGARKSKLVSKLFASWHDPELGDRIARAFRSRYEELRSQSAAADEIFHELWKFAGGGTQQGIEKEAAVLAVLAFLFEECEIFEAPRVEEPA